jgi:hypothetical protein
MSTTTTAKIWSNTAAGCGQWQLSGLRMTRVMPVHAFGKKPFPAALTATRKCGAPAFRLHPGSKTVLTFAGTLRSL